MLLPSAENAIVDVRKLQDYCLNPQHEEGRHKARVFQAALGLRQADAAWLAGEIRAGVLLTEAIPQGESAYVARYVVDLSVVRATRVATVRTAWIVRSGEALPRLVSCFVRAA